MSAPTSIVVGWLNITTEGLSLSAKERISLEINSHFEEARECHQAEGLNEADALLKAIKELGDPDAAARRFRREYLTESDFKLVQRELNYAFGAFGVSGWIFLIRDIAVAIGIIIIGFLKFEPPDMRSECLFAAMFYVGLTLARCFLTIPKRQRPYVTALLWTTIIMDCTMVVPGYALTRNLGIVAIMPFCMVTQLPQIRLLLKLRRIRDVWREMPEAMNQ